MLGVGIFRNRMGRGIGALAAVIALTSAGSALAATPTPGAHYTGATTQGRKFSFSVSHSGRRITKLHFYLVTACHPTPGP
jgi:hypothetical protein